MKPGDYQEVKMLFDQGEDQEVHLQLQDGMIVPVENLIEIGSVSPDDPKLATVPTFRSFQVRGVKTEEYLTNERQKQFDKIVRVNGLREIYTVYIQNRTALTPEQENDRTLLNLIRQADDAANEIRRLPPPEQVPTAPEQIQVASTFILDGFRFLADKPSGKPKRLFTYLYRGKKKLHLIIISKQSSKTILTSLPLTITSNSNAVKIPAIPGTSYMHIDLGPDSLPEPFEPDEIIVQTLSEKSIVFFSADLAAGIVATSFLNEEDMSQGPILMESYIPDSEKAPLRYFVLPPPFFSVTQFSELGSLKVEGWGTQHPSIAVVPNLQSENAFNAFSLSAQKEMVAEKEEEGRKSSLSARDLNRSQQMPFAIGLENILRLLAERKMNPEPVTLSDSLGLWIRQRLMADLSSFGSATLIMLPSFVEHYAPEIGNRLSHDVLSLTTQDIPANQKDSTEYIFSSLDVESPHYDYFENQLFALLTPIVQSNKKHLIINVELRKPLRPDDRDNYALKKYAYFLLNLAKVRAKLEDRGIKTTLFVWGPVPLGHKLLKYFSDSFADARWMFGYRVVNDQYSMNLEEGSKLISLPMKVAALTACMKKAGLPYEDAFYAELVRAIEAKSEGTEKPLKSLEGSFKQIQWAIEKNRIDPEAPNIAIPQIAKTYLKITQNRSDEKPFHPDILAAFRSLTSLLDATSPTRLPIALSQRSDILAFLSVRLRQWAKEFALDGRALPIFFEGPQGTGKSMLVNSLLRILPPDRVVYRSVNANTPETDKAAEPKKASNIYSQYENPNSYSYSYSNVEKLKKEIHAKLKELRESTAEVKILFLDELNTCPALTKELMSSFEDGEQSARREFNFDGILVIAAMNVDESELTRKLDQLSMSSSEYRKLSADVFVKSILSAPGASIDEKMLKAFMSRIVDGLFYFRNRESIKGNEAHETLMAALRPIQERLRMRSIVLPDDTVKAIMKEVDKASDTGNFRGVDKVVPAIMSVAIDEWEAKNPESTLTDRLMILHPPTGKYGLIFQLEDIIDTPTGIREYVREILKKVSSEINVAVSNRLAAAKQSAESKKEGYVRTRDEIIIARWNVFLEAFVTASERPLEMGEVSPTQVLRTDFLPYPLDPANKGAFENRNEKQEFLDSADKEMEVQDFLLQITDHLSHRVEAIFDNVFNQQLESQENKNEKQVSAWEGSGDSTFHDDLRDLAAEFMQGVEALTDALSVSPANELNRRSEKLSFAWIKEPYSLYLSARAGVQIKSSLEHQRAWVKSWLDRFLELKTKRDRGELTGNDAEAANIAFHRELVISHESIGMGKHETVPADAYKGLADFVTNINGIPEKDGKLPGVRFLETLEEKLLAAGLDTTQQKGEYVNHPEMVAAGYALEDLLRQAALRKIAPSHPDSQLWARGQKDNELFNNLLIAEYLQWGSEMRLQRPFSADADRKAALVAAYANKAAFASVAADYFRRAEKAKIDLKRPISFSGETVARLDRKILKWVPPQGNQFPAGISPEDIATLRKHALRIPSVANKAREKFDKVRSDANATEFEDSSCHYLVAMSVKASARLPKRHPIRTDTPRVAPPPPASSAETNVTPPPSE